MKRRNELFTDSKIDHLKSKLFLDEGKNIQRFDSHKYQTFYNANERMKAFFWTPEEISMITDMNDFKKLKEQAKYIIRVNLSYQILLDSLAARAPIQLFGTICTNNELESCFLTQTFFEGIHSQSYTHILRSLSEFDVFDKVMENEFITDRAQSIIEALVKLDASSSKYRMGMEVDEDELKRDIIRGLISVNILEGIRFYVSFACTFSFGEAKKMAGTVNIMTLIARDEKQHMVFISKLIQILRSKESEGFTHIFTKEFDAELVAMYVNAVEEELAWAEYLFKDKSVNGLNVKNITQYIHHIVEVRMKNVSLVSPYGKVKNPIPWVNKYNASSNIEVLPQETEITSYIIGVNNDEVNFDDIII